MFRGRVALITGASSGIGRAIVRGLGAHGARLCLVGRRVELLQAVAAEVKLTASEVLCYRVDLARDEDIRELAARVQQDLGGLDVLVHSAGVIALDPLEDGRVDDFDWQYRVNVRAPYLLTQGLLPMLRARHGEVVFINSTVGLSAKANAGQYAATKHALKAFADSLREEVSANGIRVLSMFLGRTATPMQAMLCELEGRAYKPDELVQPEDVATMVLSALRLGHTAEVTEMFIRPLIKPTA